ncbi:integrin alpha-PS1-like isoform X2 [Stegodyphus dumicola]|uniref:integrin alpha-PS1-like isoform X2 n=1 Tax=Stegodyphus dumicola TaxID=202533 RepID=UPI0015AE85F4|nr:integrin alpha-PS1-like isoform X2 [Stegodyphus dumicola]
MLNSIIRHGKKKKKKKLLPVKRIRLLVGSPRASTSQPGTNHSGAVYRCPISTLPKDCQQIDIENEDEPPEDDVIKDDQWLGVTVKSQGPGGYVLACAHRYIKRGPDYQWGLGICYSLSQTLDIHREWEPCLNRPVAKAHEQFGYCQAGTSADISEDHKLVIGSPGPFTWRGTVFVNSVKFGIRDDKNWYYGPLLDDEAPVEKYSYLGMAVTSGKFFGNETSFVGGAPRGNGTGQVVFFKKNKMETTFLVELVLNGEQFASSYGFSLASLDINSDGYIDLVVGSPFYYSKGIGGAVYIYMNSEEGISEETEPLKLTGKPESQFGFSLASLGDLNKDGYADLAIGAPYDDKGAVFIYLGSADGLLTEPSQVIRLENLAKEIRVKRDLSSFGYSLSGGLDLDSNGYPDLLVGAYDSDSAVLLRSRPIIDIITSVEGNLTNIDPKVMGCPEDRNTSLVCFSFEACFQFNSSVLSHGTYIKIRYRIEAETFTGKKYYRAKFKSSLNSETPNIVEKELGIRGVSLYEPHCSKQLVYLKEKTDIQTPIKFKLTYTLIQKEPRMPKEGERLPDINQYPILNQKEASKVFEAKFLKDCGSNDICESDLHISAELNLPKQKSGIPVLYLGEQQVNLSIILYNHKEPAYDAALYVTHPSTLSYIGRKVVKGEPVECVPFNSTVLKCEIGNPMNKGEVEFQIRFSPRNVSDDEKQLKFVLKANTTSIEVLPEEDFMLIADVVRVAELELRGASNPEQVVYGENVVEEENMKTGEDIGSLIIHTYELINYGPWKAKEVEIHVKWPYQTETFKKTGKWLLYIMEAPKVQGNGYCEIDPEIINPLRLQVKREEDQFIRESEGGGRESEVRVKRQAPEEIRLDPRTLNIATMDCEEGTAKCYYFKCIFRELQPDKNALISIRARLWSKTFVEDYATVDRVDVVSRASIYLDPDLDIRQKLENDVAFAVTKALPDLPLYQKPEEVPLWIIILAVCGGLLLLFLLIFCLWKLGFFKRKKPGYMPAETNEKEKELNNI